VPEIYGTIEQKRNYYLQIMQNAKQLNDQTLIKLIIKKLALLGTTNHTAETGNCIVIPFPMAPSVNEISELQRPTWWTFLKITLAIPGSVVSLFLLAHFRWGPGVF
jgi:hypothetical protein